VKHIVSRANASFKSLRVLAQSARERRARGRTLLDGPHLVRAYLQCVGQPVLAAVSVQSVIRPEIQQLLGMLSATEVLSFAPELFGQLAPVESPTGIIALIDIPQPSSVEPAGDFLVLLDRIQDPGNVGTIIRSAAAAGANAVLLCSGSADPWSPRALRAAMGATFAIEIRTGVALGVCAKRFHGQVVATAAQQGAAPHTVDLTGPIALLLGSEGEGLDKQLAASATLTVAIPLARGIESLSVGAAAAVIMFERVRQKAMKAA
jgi:TrmH family RNA methyltransferase